MEKTALVLGGGGSRGSYELGVWQALRELEIPVDIVTGTSIGAINGSLIAQGEYDIAVEVWETIQTRQVFAVDIDEEKSVLGKVIDTYRIFVRDFITSGGTDNNPLKETLQTFFDEQKIRRSQTLFGLVTVEMDSRRPHELFVDQIPEGRLIDYILASSSIYPAIRPYEIDGVRYIDGAYYDNLPVQMALSRGAERIIAVDLEAFGVVKREVLQSAPNVKYIKCHWDLGPTLIFDHEIMRRNTRFGYLDTMKAFDRYEGFAYTFLPGTLTHMELIFRSEPNLEELTELNFEDRQSKVMEKVFAMMVERFVGSRIAGKTGFDTFCMACGEIAGEIFELDGETVYSLAQYHEALEKAVASVELAAPENGLLGSLTERLNLLDKKKRTKYFAQRIDEILRTGEKTHLLTEAGVMTESFLAGVYLAICHLL